MNEKLVGKDFIVIGVFGLLFMIAQVIPAFVTAIVPNLWTYSMAIAALPCGIIFMYILAKAPKRWTITIAISIGCIIYFLIGTYGIWTPLFGVVASLVADLIAGLGNYRRFTLNAVSFSIVITMQWLGFMQPILLTTDQYINSAVESGMAIEYIQPMVDFIKGPGFISGLVLTIIGGFIGAYLGKKVLKKHFEKVGIV